MTLFDRLGFAQNPSRRAGIRGDLFVGRPIQRSGIWGKEGSEKKNEKSELRATYGDAEIGHVVAGRASREVTVVGYDE